MGPKKKALTNAERQKRWREKQKASPRKHAVYLEQHKENWKMRKEQQQI